MRHVSSRHTFCLNTFPSPPSVLGMLVYCAEVEIPIVHIANFCYRTLFLRFTQPLIGCGTCIRLDDAVKGERTKTEGIWLLTAQLIPSSGRLFSALTDQKRRQIPSWDQTIKEGHAVRSQNVNRLAAVAPGRCGCSWMHGQSSSEVKARGRRRSLGVTRAWFLSRAGD